MPSPIEDLDELILRCRDQRARLYIEEAVSSYRAGAFRSAIVACWIAVCFDIIEKLRELALSGDKEAEKHVHDLDTIRRAGDISRALRFERELLTIAKDKFELLSPIEYIDLERLQEDRNRCAHPSLTSDDQAYTPSAELARLHIHSAVINLLQHPPAQGKYALDRLIQDVESDYFPTTKKDARVAFTSGPLRRPRESLVRNFIIVLTKKLLKKDINYKLRMRIEASVHAIQELHPAIYSITISDRLSTLFRGIPDESISVAIHFLTSIKDSWQYLEEDVKQRMQNYVCNLPARNFGDLEFLLTYTPLKIQAKQRVKCATLIEIYSAAFFDMPSEVIDRLISLYLASDSFDDANSCAKQMLSHTSDFSADHVRCILRNAGKNGQVRESFQLSGLIFNLRGRNKIPTQEFESLLINNGLEVLALQDN